MLLDTIVKDSVDYQAMVRVVDASDGTPETGVAFNTAGVDLWYRRQGGLRVAITEVTQTVDGAHSDGGFVHVSDGHCRLDLPDAAIATGADFVDIGGTFTDMVVIGGRIRLTDIDLDDAVRGGLTALPNADADAAGGLPISDAGGLDLDAQTAGILSGVCQTGTLSTTQCSTDLTGYTDDQLKRGVIVFTSGPCDGERAPITGYANTNGVITHAATVETPTNGDTFKIV